MNCKFGRDCRKSLTMSRNSEVNSKLLSASPGGSNTKVSTAVRICLRQSEISESARFLETATSCSGFGVEAGVNDIRRVRNKYTDARLWNSRHARLALFRLYNGSLGTYNYVFLLVIAHVPLPERGDTWSKIMDWSSGLHLGLP
jgi:hypothetical protein